MELATVVMAAWTFLWGMIAGIKLAERRQRNSPFEVIFADSIREVRTIEKFAGLEARSIAIITDLDGSVWKMSIEREKA